MVNSSEVKQMTVDLIDELPPLVWLNNDRATVSSDKTKKKIGHCGCAFVGDSCSLWPFSEIIGTCNYVRIASIGAIDRADKVNANSMPEAIDGDRM